MWTADKEVNKEVITSIVMNFFQALFPLLLK